MNIQLKPLDPLDTYTVFANTLEEMSSIKPNEVHLLAEESKSGDVGALLEFAQLLEHGAVSSGPQIAIQIMTAVANDGHVETQFDLGNRYRWEWGVPQDLHEAAYWFRKAAEQGHVEAQVELGKLYEEGLGVKEDFRMAWKWFQAAANQGHLYAQHWVGIALATGKGREKNLFSACFWFEAAALCGCKEAKKNRKVTAKELSRKEVRRARKAARDWVAARHDDQGEQAA